MYRACLFCTADLGRNEVIEHFPVGRRLAFDAAKGRLWVVCTRCERWNLTPLEERWEAIEECERRFGATTLRASTDEIGLARLREGLELVRIGAPRRPELAAWRYGDQFGRRWRRNLLLTGAVGAASIGYFVAGPMIGLGSPLLLSFLSNAGSVYRGITTAARLQLPGGETVRVLGSQVNSTRLGWDETMERWSLDVVHLRGTGRSGPWYAYERTMKASLTGDDALRAARQLLPHVNAAGAGRGLVRDAVDLLEETPRPLDLFARVARERARPGTGASSAPMLRTLPRAVRLALEMSAHEETERRALDGELHLLEAAWRDAEEIAGIADDMFLPPGIEGDMRRLRDGG